MSDRATSAFTALIVDDEQLAADELAYLLKDFPDIDVVGTAKNGIQAVKMIEELEPELVFLDVQMPGLDGLSAAREIAGERLAAVLILTAFSQRDLIDRAKEAGVFGYLVKPFKEADLVPAIEIAISRYQEMQELEKELGDVTDQLETRKIVDRAKW